MNANSNKLCIYHILTKSHEASSNRKKSSPRFFFSYFSLCLLGKFADFQGWTSACACHPQKYMYLEKYHVSPCATARSLKSCRQTISRAKQVNLRVTYSFPFCKLLSFLWTMNNLHNLWLDTSSIKVGSI